MSYPDSETLRLAALQHYQIISTPPDPAFTNLAHLAAQACETSIAWISFMDTDRHWFKAVVGLTLSELPQTDAFCLGTMTLNTVTQFSSFVVPDTLADDRFATHPLVIEQSIRFYAGVPLQATAGVILGTLSVLDRQLRQFTPHQQTVLHTLAQQVVLQLSQHQQLTEYATAAMACHQVEEALRRTKDETELRVAERTAELVSVNQRLRLELEERKRIEAALRISQVRFAGILEIADDAIISTDSQQRISLFNQGAEKIFGYTTQEVLGQPLGILLPDRFAQMHHQHVAKFAGSSGAARRMGERSGEIWGRCKDGTEFPAEASISKLDVGEEKVFTVILRDVTQRKQAEVALERLSRQNELILNSIGEGLFGLDLQGTITFANPAAAKLLGYSVKELIGRAIQTILPNAQFTRLLTASLTNSSATHEAASGESPTHQAIPTDAPALDALHPLMEYHSTQEVFHRQDGSSFPVEYLSTLICEHGQPVGAVVVFKDISDRQVVERMKDEFISVVSHELRTPLTSIHGALGMLASGLLNADPATSQRLLHIAVESTDRLIRLINDILDIERIESGRVKMQKQPCNAANLLDKAVDVMQPMAQRSNITLAVNSLSQSITVDPDRIIQALTNLLSNAIKFSPSGSTVWLSATIASETPAAAPQLRFSVKDQGRGIPTDKLETIFERFQQVDASDSRNQDGTGLGLAICRSIVQQHSGQIWAESTLGQGSTFYFTVPIGSDVSTSSDVLEVSEE